MCTQKYTRSILVLLLLLVSGCAGDHEGDQPPAQTAAAPPTTGASLQAVALTPATMPLLTGLPLLMTPPHVFDPERLDSDQVTLTFTSLDTFQLDILSPVRVPGRLLSQTGGVRYLGETPLFPPTGFFTLRVLSLTTNIAIDMLPALKGEDSGKEASRSCFSDPAHGEVRLVFATPVPCLGTFTLAKATRKSPQVSHGLGRLYIPYALR